MANIAIPRPVPGAQGARLWKGVTWIRQYPLLPLAVLLLVLVIPAIFAPQVAPHDPIRGDVLDRLKAPLLGGREGGEWRSG